MGELSGSNDAILLHQLLLGLGALWVEGNTVHRTHLLALRLVEVADALGAQVGVDDESRWRVGPGRGGEFLRTAGDDIEKTADLTNSLSL